MSSEGSQELRAGPVGRVDLLVAAFFLVYATAFFLDRWQGFIPFVFLGGDAGNIASYAAALDHPGLFVGDHALGDPDELGFYQTIHIWLLRLLVRVVGDYGTAFIWLLGPHVWVLGVGFYVLGRVLFRNRFWAFLLAVLNLVLVELNLGTYWGAFWDPQPRFTFQALLPFVLALGVMWRRQPRRWPWIMLLAGALIYVHPVSAPAWGFALWLGLWSQHPAEWSAKRRLATMLLLGGIFLVVSAPFAVAYLGSREQGVPETVDFEVVYRILATELPSAYFDAGLAIRGFARHRQTASGLLWIAALVGVGVLFRLRGRGRELLPMVGMWTLGLFFVSVCVPYAEQIYTTARGSLPIQIDLIRGIRYFVPLGLLLALWPLAEVHHRIRCAGRPPAWGVAVALAGLALTAGWVLQHPPSNVVSGVSCWSRGRWTCPQPRRSLTLEAIEAVRTRTPVGATVLATSEELPIRYHALRPVVHSRRDIGVFLYSKHELLPQWDAVLKRRAKIWRLSSRSERFEAQLALAAELGADYALLSQPWIPRSCRVGRDCFGHSVLWRNRRYALVRVGEPP